MERRSGVWTARAARGPDEVLPADDIPTFEELS
jgi:hypothetical protein